MNELDQLRAENAQMRTWTWMLGSRLNCLLLDAPPLPSRAAFASNSDYLRACENAIDQHMQSTVTMLASRRRA